MTWVLLFGLCICVGLSLILRARDPPGVIGAVRVLLISPLMQRSAVSSSVKRTTLFQEGLRRLHNCSQDIDKQEVNMILSQYMDSLKKSGYKESYRRDLLKGIMKW